MDAGPMLHESIVLIPSNEPGSIVALSVGEDWWQVTEVVIEPL